MPLPVVTYINSPGLPPTRVQTQAVEGGVLVTVDFLADVLVLDHDPVDPKDPICSSDSASDA